MARIDELDGIGSRDEAMKRRCVTRRRILGVMLFILIAPLAAGRSFAGNHKKKSLRTSRRDLATVPPARKTRNGTTGRKQNTEQLEEAQDGGGSQESEEISE